MKISKTREVKTPTRGTDKSAGLDLYVPNDFEKCLILPGKSAFIPSGIKANVPEGHALIAFNKSGVALKKELSVGACVIDEDYQGEIHIHVFNFGTESTTISPGEKLIQLLLMPVVYESIDVVDESALFNTETSRGTGGFGSTGNY